MPATLAMASQGQKKDSSYNSPKGPDKSSRFSRKERVIGGASSNSLKRAEPKKVNSPNNKWRR
jgi:hypothetical protein